MPRERFEQELKQLAGRVLELGGLAEAALRDSVGVLQRQDLDRARELIEADHRINMLRFDLEHEALTIIATQQPVAGDLRALAAVFEIVTELERIADYAKGIATITVSIGTGSRIAPPPDLGRMGELACGMLYRSLQAYVQGDARAARGIAEEDDLVDRLYEEVYRQLMGRLLVDPRDIDQALRLTWVAHNLERVADRVGNICERIVFSITGRGEELDTPPGLPEG
jgi:phosphate transport system protein